MSSAAHTQYTRFLNRLPAPGGGGAHRAIYAAGCLGAEAGLDSEVVIKDIREHLPAGDRHVPDREIEDGVYAAYAYLRDGARKPQPSGPKVAPSVLAELLRSGRGATVEDIAARSPVPIDWPPKEAFRNVLAVLYDPGDRIFIGDDQVPGVVGQTIRPRDAWIRALHALGGCPAPKWIPNPLSGRYAPKKSGDGDTLRGDGCVTSHRFVVVEHDQLPLPDQLAFWMASPLPVAALIFSGKKSMHGIVRVDCTSAEEWQTQIREKLFPQYLVPMGFDPACQNPSRLSRAPGHIRKDTGHVQACIYLAPQGKAVSV